MNSQHASTILDSFPSDLKVAKELVYDKLSYELTDPVLSLESVEYGACSFCLGGWKIQHRMSKITPKKVGQFVTIWKRNKDGITEPFDISDEIDFIIITSRSGDNFGQFIFPVSVLAIHGIITRDGKGGKRGIRVYPPWDIAPNKQAEKTQTWQLRHFLPIKTNDLTDHHLAKERFTYIEYNHY